MKTKKYLLPILFTFYLLLFTFPAHAQSFQADYSAWSAGLGGSANAAITGGSVADIVNLFLPYLLVIAGLILFAMLLFGGFTMLTGAANKESQEKGKKMVTSALTGFGVIFLAYWLAQLLQVIFGIAIVTQ